jgi:hypothetical protein
MRKKENRDEPGNGEGRPRLHVQLHQGRLPLPSVHLQQLQLLIKAWA